MQPLEPAGAALLRDLDRYFDEVPRAGADPLEVGPFTLFLRKDPRSWPYYARPSLGARAFRVEDVTALRAQMRERGVPEQVEWVGEVTEQLALVAAAAGMVVDEHPLMLHRTAHRPPAVPAQVTLRLLDAEDPDLAAVDAAVSGGFGNREAGRARRLPPGLVELVGGGFLRMIGAFDDEGVAVGGGSHMPRGDTTELAGIAVVPSARRRGIAGALTSALIQDARDSGARTVFLSAGSEEVARLYRRAGFVRVATACIASAPPAPDAAAPADRGAS